MKGSVVTTPGDERHAQRFLGGRCLGHCGIETTSSARCRLNTTSDRAFAKTIAGDSRRHGEILRSRDVAKRKIDSPKDLRSAPQTRCPTKGARLSAPAVSSASNNSFELRREHAALADCSSMPFGSKSFLWRAVSQGQSVSNLLAAIQSNNTSTAARASPQRVRASELNLQKPSFDSEETRYAGHMIRSTPTFDLTFDSVSLAALVKVTCEFVRSDHI